MINPLRRVSALWASTVVILFAAATAAYSQAPTDAQRSAISAATPLKPLIIEKILFVIAAPSLQPKRDLQRARKK